MVSKSITLQADAIKTIQAANILTQGLQNCGGLIPPVMKEAVPAAKARARVDTGAMRDSIDYEMIDPFTAKFWVGSDHGIFNEKGTEKMSAQPMIEPEAIIALTKLNQSLNTFIGSVINGNVNIPTKPSTGNKEISTERFKRPVSGGRGTTSERAPRQHKYVSRVKVGNKWVYHYAGQ